MSKLTNLLLKYEELIKENDSGSSYFSIYDKKIRVSNHINTVFISDDLNILLPENSKKQYIMVLYGNLYVYNSFTDLRIFLENWILISKRLENRTQISKDAKVIELEDKLKKLSDDFKNYYIMLKGLTPPQQKRIDIMISEFKNQNKKKK